MKNTNLRMLCELAVVENHKLPIVLHVLIQKIVKIL